MSDHVPYRTSWIAPIMSSITRRTLSAAPASGSREPFGVGVTHRAPLVTLLVTGFMACAMLFGTQRADAATPSSGSVSPSSTTATFTGGPFDFTNESGVPPIDPAPGVPPACVDPALPCDDFALTTSIPGADPHSYGIQVAVTFGGTADFDLWLMDSDGTTIEAASANTAGEPELVTIHAPAGVHNYIVRVIPYDVTTGSSGDTYAATVTMFQDIAPDPPDPPELPTIPGVARFKTYAAPDGMGESAGEPSIGTNWSSGKTMFQASLETLRVGYDDCSSPAETTWEDKSPITSAETLDPILFTDRLTHRTFVSQLTGACSATSFTDDDGDSYTPSQGCGTPAGADHQTFGGGPFAPGPNGPTTAYPNAVYYCSQENETSLCALSQNGGLTFGPGIPAWNATQCGAIHGHIKVAPDGAAYVPNRSCGGSQGVIVTTNNGLTWNVRIVTGSTPPKAAALVDPSLGIGSQGRLYFGYMGSDGHARIAVSNDQGVTWGNNQDVGAALGIKNTTFPVVVAGDNDRAAFGFLGTMTDGDYGDNVGFNGVWHLYVAVTYDGGVTWNTVDATPHDPVQRGSICNQGTVTCMHTPDDRNLLDFNDITIDKFGRILVAFSDGCVTNLCIHGAPGGHTSNDFTSKATIARQSGGRGLLSQYDPNPQEPVAPKAPQIEGTRTAPSVVNLRWSNPDNGGSAITSYKIYRGTTSGGETLLNTVTARNSFNDISADPATGYYYRITAVNASGEGAFCREVYVDPVIGPSTDPCSGPGSRVSTDVSDGAPNVPPTASVNINYLSVSEPYFTDNSSKMVFNLQVGGSMVPTPNSQWYIMWNRPTPDSTYDRDYVAMKTGPTGTPSYEYGKISPPNANLPTRFGAADDGSYDAMTGIIRITMSTSGLDSIGAGQTLSAMQARSFFSRADGLPVTQTASNDYSPEGLYTLVGNASCRPNAAPTAVLSTTPIEGCVPLTVTFNGASSTDPDAGDTIGSYQFGFGDGTPDVIQSSPTTMHTYNSNGEYGARLHVTDSRGKISQNVDLNVIEVHPLPMASAAGSTTICAGTATTINGTGGESCTWTPATGLSNPSSCVTTASPTQTTTYTLHVESEEGCNSANQASVTITVVPCAINEIDSLRWASGTKDTLLWGSQENATDYRLYRGQLGDLPQLLNASLDSCVRFEGPDTTTGPVLAESPAVVSGRLYWYLVNGVNGMTEGSSGYATSGPRIINASGPCP